MPQPYKRAPIIEAVIEIRFVSPQPSAKLERVSDALSRHYPNLQEFLQYHVEIGPKPGTESPVRASQQDKVWRRSANDEQNIATIGPTAFGVSQLAPYEKWVSFFDRFCRDWRVWTDKVGRPHITRIGLRYINRIDIPVNSQPLINQGEYVTLLIQAPLSLGSTRGYAVNATFDAPKSPCTVVINTGMAPFQIIPGFASVTLDIDLGAERDLPQNDEGIFVLLEKMREDKNFLFEQCITEKARTLFQ